MTETMNNEAKCGRVWIEVPGQAIVDVDAFVLFKMVNRVGYWDHGEIVKEPSWLIQAFPGPRGEFTSLALFAQKEEADQFLADLYQALIQIEEE